MRSLRARAAVDKKLGTRYVPSFLPPSLAAANRAREEKPASVFELPAKADKSKPRAIDAVLEEMQRCVRRLSPASSYVTLLLRKTSSLCVQ
jgi:hypothetical protein